MMDTLKQMQITALVEPDLGNPPSPIWQEQAREFVDFGRRCLWDEVGAKALAWLRARGLTDDTIRFFQLGFNPVEREDDPGLWEMEGKKIWLPRGVVILCEASGLLWYVRIRRPRGDPKFAHIRGGKVAPFGADYLGDDEGRLLLVCKGEFDAMLAIQEAGDLLDVIVLGGAAGRRIAQTRHVLQVRFPDGGDLTDYHVAGGDLRGLLASAVHSASEQPAVRQPVMAF